MMTGWIKAKNWHSNSFKINVHISKIKSFYAFFIFSSYCTALREELNTYSICKVSPIAHCWMSVFFHLLNHLTLHYQLTQGKHPITRMMLFHWLWIMILVFLMKFNKRRLVQNILPFKSIMRMLLVRNGLWISIVCGLWTLQLLRYISLFNLGHNSMG